MTKVLYPGSFDSTANGHLSITTRTRDLSGEMLMAVGCNSLKVGYLFGGQHIGLVREVTAHLGKVIMEEIDGLLVDSAREHGTTTMVRGLRFDVNFDFEPQPANMNHSLADLETILLPAAAQHVTLPSTIIREVIKLGGDVSPHVPPCAAGVAARLWDARQPRPALVFRSSGDPGGLRHRITGTSAPDCG